MNADLFIASGLEWIGLLGYHRSRLVRNYKLVSSNTIFMEREERQNSDNTTLDIYLRSSAICEPPLHIFNIILINRGKGSIGLVNSINIVG